MATTTPNLNLRRPEAADTVNVTTDIANNMTAIDTAVAARVPATLLTANGKGFVSHGATAGTARPSGFASIEWYGSVEPTNAVNGDTWVDTSA